VSIRIALPVTSLLIALLGAACVAQEPVIWQVGTPDGSGAEFGLYGKWDRYKQDGPGGLVTYRPGQSDPAKNWYYVQPGPKDQSWAGEGDHRYEVVFDLADKPSGPYVIKLDILGTSATNPPVLKIGVNDHVELIPLKPGTSDSPTAEAGQERQTVTMYVAGGWLNKGGNCIYFTVQDGSWLTWDSASFAKCTALPRLIRNLKLAPTCLFKGPEKRLRQVVRVSMDLYDEQSALNAEISTEKGWRVERKLDDVSSGSPTFDMEVPEVAAAQKVRLKITAGGEIDECEAELRPGRHWKIYMLPTSHFDYGYHQTQDGAAKIHRDNIDDAMDYCTTYPGFKWDLESAFMAEDYLANGSRPEEFLRLAKQGRIGVLGLYTNTLTGICTSEGFSHVLDYYDYLRHSYGIGSKCAMENDIASMVATTPMILREHGIKYLSHGVNTVRAKGNDETAHTPFYWEAPDGSKVLTWEIVGNYAEAGEITELDDTGNMPSAKIRVQSIISDYEHRADYPFDAILMHGGYGDNWPIGRGLARVPDEWNKTYTYPKIIFSNGPEFFQYVESKFGADITTRKGDCGVWWEDGVGSSARETGLNRVAEERLVTAQKIASVCSPDFQRKTAAEFAEAWRWAMLHDEHTWGAEGSVWHPESKPAIEQWAVKRTFSMYADEQSNRLLRKAMDELCGGLRVGKDSVLVFNPSSWARSEWMDFEGRGGHALSLYADSVPPMGYKVFPLSRAVPSKQQPVPGNTLENRYYRITFDAATGAVASIFDKDLGRELVDPKPYGANCYLYVSGGDTDDWSGPNASTLQVNVPSGARFEKLQSPGAHVMKISAEAMNAKDFSSEVILYHNCKRIDFVNRMDKVETLKKEGGYFAFPFAFKNPQIRLEIPDGVIRPEIDQLPAACRDWYCVQNFATISDGGAAVAWSAVDSPLVTLQDVNRAQWRDHIKIENGSVFAYVFNNYWFTNYKASQGGPLTFRFSMTSARSVSDIQAKRFGETVHQPLVCKIVNATPGAKNSTSRSFVSVAGDDIILQAVAPARFTDGVVLRLREMSGKATTARVDVRGISFKRAYLSNLGEDKLKVLAVKNGAIEVKCRALGLTTIILER